MSDLSLRHALFQRYTQFQMWLISRAAWYVFLLYLATLVLFALLRMFTGISVKRIGYFSLRHITLTPKQGVEIRIGKLGIAPHRPTVARPGLLTFVLSNLEIIVDPSVTIERDMRNAGGTSGGAQPSSAASEPSEGAAAADDDAPRANGFDGVPLLPRINSPLFRFCRWAVTQMKVFDVQLHSVSLGFTDVITLIITSVNMRIDVRKTRNYQLSNFVGTLDTYKLGERELPIQAKLGVSDVYIAESLEDEVPWQAFEDARVDISGVLNTDEMRAKELGVQIHCGRIQLDVEQFIETLRKIQKIRAAMEPRPERAQRKSASPPPAAPPAQPPSGASSESHVEWPPRSSGGPQHGSSQPEQSADAGADASAGARAGASADANAKAKVFGERDRKRIVDASMLLLHLVHKVQLNVGIVEVLRVPVDAAFFAIRMRDMNLDLSRMNPQSSGFKLYYDNGDVAHQSVFTVTSLTAGIDTGSKQEEILYVPLVTSLSRSNLFSQTLRFVREDMQKNDAVFRSGWVFHAPNLTIEEHQIATLVRVALGLDGRSRSAASQGGSAQSGDDGKSGGATAGDNSSSTDSNGSSGGSDSFSPVSDLGFFKKVPFQNVLPNIDLDLTVNDPGFRLVCDSTEQCHDAMFVLSSNRVHLAVKSTHNSETNAYSGTATLETSGDNGYYHSSTESKIDIVSSDSTQVTVRASTVPEFNVEIEGKQRNLHFTALRHEIFCAIGQLHATTRKPLRKWSAQRKHHRKPEAPVKTEVPKGSLRVLPAWLKKFRFSALNSRMAIATNQFRGQTYEILGLKLVTDSFSIGYESALSCEELDPDSKRFAVLSSTDGRCLRVSGSNIVLYKADQILLGQWNEPSVAAQHSVVQMPKLDLVVRTHDETQATIMINIEPRLRIDLNVNLILAFSVVREIIDKALLRHVKESDDLDPRQPADSRPRRDSVQSFHSARSHHSSKSSNSNAASTSTNEHKEETYTYPKTGGGTNGGAGGGTGSTSMSSEAEAATIPRNPGFIERHNTILTMPRALIKIDMPSDDQVMLEMGSSTVRKMTGKNPEIFTRAIRLYSQHPFKRTSWCIIASLHKVDIEYVLNARPRIDDKINLNVGGMRINVPYKFKLYRIIDNGITLAKAIKTLILQTRQFDWMIVLDPKQIENVPNVPRIRLRTQQLQIGLEDDYFESDLTLVMLTQQNVESTRRRKLWNFDTRVKYMLREGLAAIQSQEDRHPLNSKTASHTATPRHKSPADDEGHSSDSHADQMAKHMATNVRKTATTVFDHLHDQHHSTPEPHEPKDRKDMFHSTLVNALRHVPQKKLEVLLAEGLELGCLAEDGDPVYTKTHPWLEFWSSPDFKDFRKMKMMLSDGAPSKMTVDEARVALLEDFSRMWVDTIRRERKIQHLGVKLRRNAVFKDELNPETCAEESIIDYSQKPLSMSIDFRQLDLVIDKTTHDTSQKLHKFLHDVGKGQPMDSKFSILVPLFMDLRAHGGLKIDIKDFPLPVLHFPALARNQDPKNHLALRVKGDLIVTEQLMASVKNIRKIFVPLRPLTRDKQSTRGSDVIEVHRTLTPIKTFTDLKFHVGSTMPTRVCWCMAYKPGFHGVGESFSGFSKPPIDPSPVLGFWDKIRLVLHARFDFELPKSSLCLCLKAGKSPYELLGGSSGFVFAWRDQTRVLINSDDDPRKLFTFSSNVFELVVPDYMNWEKEYLGASPAARSLPRAPLPEKLPRPEKVVFSFAQRTVWRLGMLFQKNSTPAGKDSGGVLETRDADFRNHFDVTLCMPEFIKDVQQYDAYAGFRSDFIFLAISVESRPVGGPDIGTGEANHNFTPNINNTASAANNKGDNKCAAHLTLGVINHFRFWKNQFNGEQWPPIKTGSLFPDPVRVRPSNKTFGTALSTAEYQIALSPLDLSFFHQMRHHRAAENHDRCTGIKAKIEEFVFDWHTRREPPEASDENGEEYVELDSHRRWRMKSYNAEVRLNAVQVRVIDAKLRTQSSKAALRALHDDDNSDSDPDDGASETGSSTDDQSSSYHDSRQTKGSKEHYGPHYLGDDFWIDLDDYSDVGKHRKMRSRTPTAKIYPLLYTPQFNYLRSTDFSGTAVYVDRKTKRRVPKFGQIRVHKCMFQSEQPERRQAELLDTRRRTVQDQICDFKASLESLEQDQLTGAVRKQIERLRAYIAIGELNERVLKEEMMRFYALAEDADAKHSKLQRVREQNLNHHQRLPTPTERDDAEEVDGDVFEYAQEDPEYAEPFREEDVATEDDFSLFQNRYVIHALHLKWNNSVRNLIYRLQTTICENKELDYVSCRRAVQYLEELVSKAEGYAKSSGQSGADMSDGRKQDHGKFMKKISCKHKKDHHPANSEPSNVPDSTNNPDAWDDGCKLRLKTLFDELISVPESEYAMKSHYVSFLTPRIQLIAEENPTSCLMVTARDIKLQVVDTYPRAGWTDTDSANIERRYGAVLNQSGFFVLNEDDARQTGFGSLCLERYSGEEEDRTDSWPPWLAIEICYDASPLKQFSIVQDVSFGVRLNSPNDLHVASQGDEVEEESIDVDTSEGSEAGQGPTWEGQTPEERKLREQVEQALEQKAAEARYGSAHGAAGNGSSNGGGANGAGGEDGENGENGGETGVPGISHHLSQTLRHHGHHKGKAFLSSLVVDAPRVVINMDSYQFYTFYTILVDLLTYRDPLIKKHEQAIDRVFLSNNFEGDYRATLERIEWLQKDIRTILTLYEKLSILNMNQLEPDRNAKIHLIKLERECIRRQTQLTVVIRAFKAVLRKNMNTGVEKLSKWSLLADSIFFRILDECGTPVAEVYLRKVHYSRLSNEDSGSLNRATLAGIYAKNLLPGSTYPLMVANYEHDKYRDSTRDAVKLKWTRLDRVGGIPVLDNAEVKLKPLHIQVEHGIFERILDFAFPISHSKDKNDEDGNDDAISRSDSDDDGMEDEEEAFLKAEIGSIGSGSQDSLEFSDSEKESGKSGKNGSKHKFLGGLLHSSSGGSKNRAAAKERSEIDEMMNRASNYWSIRSLVIHPTQLTVSYKGKSKFSLLNLQNLQISTPLFAIHNKTCSKLDLIMRIRKMAIKQLLAQSGSIIGNKFKRHKNHAIEDDRDLNLERLTSRSSRLSDITADLKHELHRLSHQLSKDEAKQLADVAHRDSRESRPFDEAKVLTPMHREKARADPSRAREIIWGDLDKKRSQSGGSVIASSDAGRNRGRVSSDQRRVSEDRRRVSVERARATQAQPTRSGTPLDARASRQDSARGASMERTRSVSGQSRGSLDPPGSPRRLRRPEHGSSKPSFLEKIKKGFHHLD